MFLSQLLPELELPPAQAQLEITGLNIDSRRIEGGDLFLACRGQVHDGNRFIDQAIAQGAVAVLSDSEACAGYSVPVIQLPELARMMPELAARFFNHPSKQMLMIGVTGTNGKTSCSHYIAQALTRLGRKTAVIGTTGNGFVGSLSRATHTTPDAVQLQKLLAGLYQQQAEAVAMEVSSHALEQGRVQQVAFDQAVFTNLSRDHLDYHGTMEAYAAAKKRLFTDCGASHAVINTDDDYGLELWQQLPASINALAIGERVVDHQRQLLITESRMTSKGIEASIDSPWGRLQVSSALLGGFNLHNLLCALAVLINAGAEPQQAVAVLGEIEGVEGRMQAFGGDRQPLVVVDYAHTPDALDKVLASLREHCSGQLHCLFGCGGDRDRGKRALMAQAAEQHADRLMVTSDNPRGEEPQAIIDEIMAGLVRPELAQQQVDRGLAIEQAIAAAQPGDVVLVAGKGHEDYQEVQGQRLPFSDIEQVRSCLRGQDAD